MSPSNVLLIFIPNITSANPKSFISNLQSNIFLIDVIILSSLLTISMSSMYKHIMTYLSSLSLTYLSSLSGLVQLIKYIRLFEKHSLLYSLRNVEFDTLRNVELHLRVFWLYQNYLCKTFQEYCQHSVTDLE